MKKYRLKFLVILIMIFGISGIFENKVEAYDLKYNKATVTSKTINSISYTRPSSLIGVTNALSYLKNKQGVFCLDHSKGLSQWNSVFKNSINVTTKCNGINYILGCQKPLKSGKNYRYSLPQNYIWKYAKSLFGSSISSGTSTVKSYNYQTLKNANSDYESYEKNKLNKGITVAKIEDYKSNNKTIKLSKDDVKISSFKMNNYTYAYSSNCSYVNNQVKYNKYNNLSKQSKRAGVLAGIVDATVTVYENGEKTSTLTHSNGDFKFVYSKNTEERKNKNKQGNYKYEYYSYPLPNEEFSIKIPKGKFQNFGSQSLKIVINFQYIRVKSNNISSATVYKCDDYSKQKLLCVAAGMHTKVWTRKYIYKYSPAKPQVTLKVYAVHVQNGEHINKTKLKLNDNNGTIKEAARQTFDRDKKKQKRFAIEPGATMTFKVVITNKKNEKTRINGITITGNQCLTNAEITEIRRKNNGNTETKKSNLPTIKYSSKDATYKLKKYDSDDNYILDLASKEEVVMIIKTKDVVNTKSRYFKVILDEYYFKDNSNTKIKNLNDLDCWYNTNYNVTIDKYINKVNKEETNISSKREEGKPKDNLENDEENIEDEKVESSDSEENDDGKTDQDGEIDNSKDDEEGKTTTNVYLGSRLEKTEQIQIDKDTTIDAYPIYEKDSNDTILCYYYNEKYYYMEAGIDYYIDVTKYIKDDSNGQYFDMEDFENEIDDSSSDLTNDDFDNKIYIMCDSSGNIMNGNTKNEQDGYDIYEDVKAVVGYEKDGKYYRTTSDRDGNINNIEINLKDDENGKYYEYNWSEDSNSPDFEVTKVYIKRDSSGNIIRSTNTNEQGGYDIYNDYNEEDMVIIGYKKDGKYYNTDNEEIEIHEENGKYYIIVDAQTEVVHIKCDENKEIVCSSDANDKKGYNIYNQSDDAIIGYVCYNEETKELTYYDTNDNQIIIEYDGDGYPYTVLENSSDLTYLNSNSNGIIHDSPAKDSYFYPVMEMDSDEGEEPVCYYHAGITKKDNNIYFVYDEINGVYNPVRVKKDNTGYYIDESSIKHFDNRIYVQCDENGKVVVKDGKVYDQTGSTEVCEYKNSKYYYTNGEYEASDKIEVSFENEDGCYYIDTNKLSIEPNYGTVNSLDIGSQSISARRKRSNDEKQNCQVEIRSDSSIEYFIDIYNTAENEGTWGVESRQSSTYGAPYEVYVNVKDKLPGHIKAGKINYTYTYFNDKKEEVKEEKLSKGGTVDYSSNEISFSNVKVFEGGYTRISYTLETNLPDDYIEVSEENKATLDIITNSNGVDITGTKENEITYNKVTKKNKSSNRNKADSKYKTSSDWFENAPSTTKFSTADGEVYITNVQHATDSTGDKTTFDGKTNSAYVEYGDKVSYDIVVNNEYRIKNEGTKLYDTEYKNYQSAKVTLKIDFPDDMHEDNGNYLVKINGQLYTVPKSQRDGFTYVYQGSLSDDKDFGNEGYDYIDEIRNCVTSSNSFHYTKIKDRRVTVNDTIKVELVTDGKDAGSSYSLSATLESIEYTIGEGKKAWDGPYPHDHPYTYTTTDSEGNSVTRTSTYPDTRRYTFDDFKTKIVPYSYSPNLNLGTATYTTSDYKMDLDEYICKYNAEMAKYNDANEFTTGEGSQEFDNGTKSYNSTNNALPVEKYETLTFATKITNTISEGEEENNTASSGKYKTRVRPQQVTQKIAAGLEIQKIEIALDGENGKLPERNNIIDVSRNDNTITYNWKNYDKILSPGQSVIYYVTVKVKESNLSLANLETNSVINSATNINHQKTSGICGNKHDRYIPDASVAGNKKDQDYVKLKDLVIAGKVWLDGNRDGKMADNEAKKPETIVKLYQNNKLCRTTKTNSNGQYSFIFDETGKNVGRVPKANGNNYYNYYVEFEYDGVKYKASEVYGGDADGDADGMHTLRGKEGSKTWRQGNNIPDATSGDTNYMIDSNAYEFDNVRNDFDDARSTIGYNKTYNGTTPTSDLSYTKDGHVSTLNETKENNIMTSRSFIKQNYGGSTSSTNSNDTNTLFLSPYTGYSNTYPETEYLKYINLGLVEREKADVSIEADVYSVKTQINGEEMTYNFNKNAADSTKSDYDKHENAYRLKQAYNLNLYKSDYNYRYDDYYDGNKEITNTTYAVEDEENELKKYKTKESELATQVTYRITMHNNKNTNDETSLPNNDIPIETAINEVAIYYDANYMKFNNASNTFNTMKKDSSTGILSAQSNIVVDGRYKTANGNQLSINDNSNYRDFQNGLNNQYNVLYLRGDNANGMGEDYIKEGDSRDIYVTFTIDKDASRTLRIGDLKMIAEVSAFTTKYGDNYRNKALAGQKAGLVDKDSNPGNLDGVEDYNNFEDDTYKANIDIGVLNLPTDPKNPGDPGSGTRYITGMVWDDARSTTYGDTSTGIQYLGNGEYNAGEKSNSAAKTNTKITDGDKPIKDVKVTLIEVVQTDTGKYYEYPARNSNNNIITATTDSNGKYVLSDYMPGYYKVRFDYGYNKDSNANVIYNGQDYKSTAYYDVNYNAIDDNIGSNKNYTYFDNVYTELGKDKKSDARDDEIRRLNVNSYSETMTTKQAKVLSEIERFNDVLTRNTWMYAESAIFYTKPEQVKSEKFDINAVEDLFKNRFWNIQNLDFGLEYRPEASIILDKDIETLELVTSDNETLVKLYFKDNENENESRVIDEDKSIGNENVQFVPNTAKTEQGFAYINIDTDILEGCTIKVEYKMDAQNNSEVDRINNNLYEIRYEQGAIDKNYGEKVYISKNNNYSANGTAAQFLEGNYYNGYEFDSPNGKETFKYLTKIKKTYSTEEDMDSQVKGTDYYGMYLGETYYKGTKGNSGLDKVSQLKVDHILDYIDNDFTFQLSDNKTDNRLWQLTTSAELKDVLDWEKVNKVEYDKNNGYGNLIDKYGIKFDTENRTNLVLSVDDNKRGIFSDARTANGNALLSRFLQTVKENAEKAKNTGTISAVASKILSADDISTGTGLSYENLAEVVQYTSLTGRRTTLPDSDNGGGGVIGNANVNNWEGYNKWEDDTDATEVITISPPTGLK